MSQMDYVIKSTDCFFYGQKIINLFIIWLIILKKY
jgi:hypothetical protein